MPASESRFAAQPPEAPDPPRSRRTSSAYGIAFGLRQSYGATGLRLMAARMCASRRLRKEHVAGPTQLAHPGLRGIVGADDPAFEVLEMVGHARHGRSDLLSRRRAGGILFRRQIAFQPLRCFAMAAMSNAPSARETGAGSAPIDGEQ